MVAPVDRFSADVTETWRPAPARCPRRMLVCAPEAVRQAGPALDWQRRLGNPLLRGRALEAALPVTNAALRLLRA